MNLVMECDDHMELNVLEFLRDSFMLKWLSFVYSSYGLFTLDFNNENQRREQ